MIPHGQTVYLLNYSFMLVGMLDRLASELACPMHASGAAATIWGTTLFSGFTCT